MEKEVVKTVSFTVEIMVVALLTPCTGELDR